MDVKDFRRDILRYKGRIINTVRANQVVIILGDTGSGKTTQIPQYLLDAGINNSLSICISQPWRVGAILAATKVLQNRNTPIGQDVGFEVAGDKKSDHYTKIKYVTEDILLDYFIKDKTLTKVGVVIIDEAHTSSAENNILLSILKETIKKRKDLKVVITSARMGDKRLSAFFENAPIISIERRRYKVSTIYEKCSGNNYIKHSLKIINRICEASTPGDILVFLPCDRDVEICCQKLGVIGEISVIPLYSSRRGELPTGLLTPPEGGLRRVIVSSCIAESIVTTDRVRFVIDCGSVTENVFHIKQEVNVTTKLSISREQSELRRRLGGRKDSGFCYRLYTSAMLEDFLEESVSSIKTKDMCGLYLKVLAMKYDPLTLDYIDPSDMGHLSICQKQIHQLVDFSKGLSPFWRNFASLNLHLTLGVGLYNACETKCYPEMIIIASVMAAGDVFIYSKDANVYHQTFYDSDGDHFTNLNVFSAFLKNNKSKQWCDTNCLNFDVLVEANDIREQVNSALRNGQVTSLESSPWGMKRRDITYALAIAHRKHVCRRNTSGTYTTDKQKLQVDIHPNNALFKESPELVLFHKIVQTQKPFMFGILRIDDSLLQKIFEESNKISCGNLKNIEKLKRKDLKIREVGKGCPLPTPVTTKLNQAILELLYRNLFMDNDDYDNGPEGFTDDMDFEDSDNGPEDFSD